jgi:hypothetical protein
MESFVVGMAVLAIVGYGLYKIFVKKETVEEAVTEIKNEVVAEAKKVEETVAPVVKAEVAKVVEAVKVEAVKVEEVVVAEVKKAATKAKAAAKKTADVDGDGKVDAADVKAGVKKVIAAAKKGGRPKKSA